MRSPESVFQEIKLLHERGVRNIEILDDNFLLNKKRCHLILDKIIESEIDMSFRVRSRVSSADEELWKKMKRAGVYAVSFGMESGSQKMLDKMRKGTKIEDNIRAAALTKKYGMMCFSSWVFGMPGESEDTIRETENHILLRVKPTTINVMIVLPFPMTPIYYEEMEKGNILGNWSSLHSKYPCIKLESFRSNNELRERVRKVNRKFMFSPYFLINMAKYFIISPNKNMIRYALRFLRNNIINRISDLIFHKERSRVMIKPQSSI
jgi:anaerobic magnesium-protoporphyrin IX monomethyl ester cyclase